MPKERDQLNKDEDWRSKAVDLARDMGSFVARFIEGPLEQGIGIYEDKLKYARWQRQIRYMEKVQQELEARGLSGPTRRVPLKIAIPIFQAASIEDDNDLQDRWATLLVNAADKDRGIEVRRTYVSILENLGSLEVQILEKIYSVPSATPPKELWTYDLPAKVHTEQPSPDTAMPSDEVRLALANLVRLGCLESAMAWKGGGTVLRAVYQTVLGAAFREACTSPPTQPPTLT